MLFSPLQDPVFNLTAAGMGGQIAATNADAARASSDLVQQQATPIEAPTRLTPGSVALIVVLAVVGVLAVGVAVYMVCII